MKRLTLTLLLAAVALGAFAQEKEKEIKKGWSFGLLPTATWSTDNGFQAGAFGDVYYYGDGKTYPDPLHKISWEASYFTHSHRMRMYLAYDSKYLIPNMRVNASVTYMNDPLYTFWGFNGAASTQNYDIWSNKNYIPNKKGEVKYPYIADALDNSPIATNYYGMSRSMLRVLANLQGQIVPHLNWAAGINFWWWQLGDMKDRGNKDNEGNVHKYDLTNTLYQKYISMGAIRPAEAQGGLSLEMNAGIVYDTRDIEAAPNRGIWAEAYLNGAPYAGNPKTGLYSPYLKACVYFRHYIDIPIHIPAGDPVFAYRLAWQQTLAGDTPFYMIQNVPLLVQRNMISEGFGSSNTVRGLRENRILAEGFAWLNAELRVKLVNFKLFNQFFYIAVNPFFDAGIITKPYRVKELAAAADADGIIKDLALDALKVATSSTEYAGINDIIYDASKVHKFVYSPGIGLKIAMNQNFIVSAEYAYCFTGGMNANPWIGIGINYQF
ncbi:MAG: hypothetical protein IJ795_02605 [Bacteroidales bacterium]|nr:hypothetical protein [Bacteroidales bacterium]